MAQEMIGKYRVIELIASGTQGSVYRAYDPDANRLVAIKVLHPGLTADATYIERFQREASITAAVDHPNVVEIFDVGEDRGRQFIVLEFLPENLSRLIETGALPVEHAVGFAIGIADGVGAVHELGIIHRDLKPQNVLITPGGTPKVTDFGIARIEGSATMTGTGVLMGTPYYMAPEQVEGIRADERSDVYALGCVLYQMLSGEVPFDGDTPLSVLRKHVEQQAPRLRTLRSEIPRELAHVVEVAMAKDPDDRYANGAAFAQAVRSAVPGIEGVAVAQYRSSGGTTDLPPNAGEPNVTPIGGGGTGRSRTRQLLLLVAGAAVIAIVAGLASVLTLGGGNGSPSESPSTALSPTATTIAAPEAVTVEPSASPNIAEVITPTSPPTLVPAAPTAVPAAPNVNVSADHFDGQVPLHVEFNSIVDGDAEGWEWDFGDGGSSTAQNPQHTFTRTGDYIVSLVVEGPGGSTESKLIEAISVRPGPPNQIIITDREIVAQAGTIVQIGSQLVDKYDNRIDQSLSWVVPSHVGLVSGDGVFEAAHTAGFFAGAITVSASSTDVEIEQQVDVTITPGPLSQATLAIDVDSFIVGESFEVLTTAVDRYGNAVIVDSVSWSGDAISDSSGNRLTAGTMAGTFENGIVAAVRSGPDVLIHLMKIELVPGPVKSIEPERPLVIARLTEPGHVGFNPVDRFGNSISDIAIEWSASDGFVVDQNGNVTPVVEGTTGVLTATVEEAGVAVSAEITIASPPVIVPLPDLFEKKDGHSITPLPDGTALVLASIAEIYDPVTMQFERIAPPIGGRGGGHTATFLLDGRLLIVGGHCGGTTEFFDPITKTFAPSQATLEVGRWNHSATLLEDGRVLVAGGECGGDSISVAELYDPATDSFSTVESQMVLHRTHSRAERLPDGRVLFSGGDNLVDGVGSCPDLLEVFDPESQVFSAVGSMVQGGTCPVSKNIETPLLGDNRVLLLSTQKFVEFFDIELNRTILGQEWPWAGESWVYTAVPLPDDLLFVFGGESDGVAKDVAMIYDPVNDVILSTLTLNHARWDAPAALLADGSVLIVSGNYDPVPGVILPIGSAELLIR